MEEDEEQREVQRRQGEDGKRSPAPLDFKFLMQHQLLGKKIVSQ